MITLKANDGDWDSVKTELVEVMRTINKLSEEDLKELGSFSITYDKQFVHTHYEWRNK